MRVRLRVCVHACVRVHAHEFAPAWHKSALAQQCREQTARLQKPTLVHVPIALIVSVQAKLYGYGSLIFPKGGGGCRGQANKLCEATPGPPQFDPSLTVSRPASSHCSASSPLAQGSSVAWVSCRLPATRPTRPGLAGQCRRVPSSFTNWQIASSAWPGDSHRVPPWALSSHFLELTEIFF